MSKYVNAAHGGMWGLSFWMTGVKLKVKGFLLV